MTQFIEINKTNLEQKDQAKINDKSKTKANIFVSNHLIIQGNSEIQNNYSSKKIVLFQRKFSQNPDIQQTEIESQVKQDLNLIQSHLAYNSQKDNEDYFNSWQNSNKLSCLYKNQNHNNSFSHSVKKQMKSSLYQRHIIGSVSDYSKTQQQKSKDEGVILSTQLNSLNLKQNLNSLNNVNQRYSLGNLKSRNISIQSRRMTNQESSTTFAKQNKTNNTHLKIQMTKDQIAKYINDIKLRINENRFNHKHTRNNSLHFHSQNNIKSDQDQKDSKSSTQRKYPINKYQIDLKDSRMLNNYEGYQQNWNNFKDYQQKYLVSRQFNQSKKINQVKRDSLLDRSYENLMKKQFYQDEQIESFYSKNFIDQQLWYDSLRDYNSEQYSKKLSKQRIIDESLIEDKYRENFRKITFNKDQDELFVRTKTLKRIIDDRYSNQSKIIDPFFKEKNANTSIQVQHYSCAKNMKNLAKKLENQTNLLIKGKSKFNEETAIVMENPDQNQIYDFYANAMYVNETTLERDQHNVNEIIAIDYDKSQFY